MGNMFKGIITVGVLFFAVIVAYGLVRTAPEPEQFEPEEIATSIRVVEIDSHRVELTVRSQGSVVPHKQSELVPEVDGKVKWMSPNLVAGGYFDKGEVLLRLDDRDYQAKVGRSQAALSRAEAEEELARFERQRMDELVKRKLTSQSTMEVVLRNHRIAQATLTEAKIALEQAKRDLARTELRAPYFGLVRTEQVDMGQFLSRGQSIASIYGGESAEIRLPVADRQLAYLDLPLGQRGELGKDKAPTVLITTEYGGVDYEWVGKLVRTEAEIDAKSRMVTAVARVENAENPNQPNLPVGLFVNAEIKGRWVEDIVTLPRGALRNLNQVLIVDTDNRIEFRNVDILRYEDDNVMISGGLNTGDLVNISPIQTVIEGMKVNPIRQTGS
ncbi:MAG: RND family efflux transporter MFP subunit [Candidatus Azotimanducaceae bacterium]|jgi:RND family efflux transporter MFP subunit